MFILKAPELQLDESSRVGFDMDNFDAEAKFERAPDGTIRIMKRPDFEKPPEYGSVEWVLQQPRGRSLLLGPLTWILSPWVGCWRCASGRWRCAAKFEFVTPPVCAGRVRVY